MAAKFSPTDIPGLVFWSGEGVRAYTYPRTLTDEEVIAASRLLASWYDIPTKPLTKRQRRIAERLLREAECG